MQVLVTRPPEEAEELAGALAARGLAALIEPLLTIRHTQGPPPDLAGVQAVLCTSANGVRALARASGGRGVPLFAVGDATAARARAEGFLAVASAGGNVEDLARLAASRLDPERGRLLHVAGTVVAGDLAGELRARGFAVDRAVLYQARPAAALSPATTAALRAGLVGAALFFSPRTAALFARLASLAGVAPMCRAAAAVSISTAADAALGELPWRRRLVAARPNQASLIEALDLALAGTA
jgi:uroporphyrinogen-III synthase